MPRSIDNGPKLYTRQQEQQKHITVTTQVIAKVRLYIVKTHGHSVC